MSHVIHWELVQLDKTLSFVEERVSILVRDVRWLCSRVIPVVKGQWRHRPIIRLLERSSLICVVPIPSSLLIQVFFCLSSRMNQIFSGG